MIANRYLCYIATLAVLSLPISAPAVTTRAYAQPTSTVQTKEQALKIEVYNPGPGAMFPVASVLVTGKQDAILIDTQFSAADARKLVDLVQSSGKRLVAVYISQSDPDYYFGLDIVQKAFPDVPILATPQTIARMKETVDGKLKVWGPKLGENAPARIVMPQPLQGDTLTLEGQTLKIVGLDGPEPSRSFVWIPSISTVLGGIPVHGGRHLFMADARTAEAQANWLTTLDRIRALQPKTVIPGHFIPGAPLDLRSVDFTASYIRAFQEEAAKAKKSTELIAAMKKRFPNLGSQNVLDISAKVATGEMQW
ncbi:MBL fold metallo-hydrolase [Brucella haematophila]|uniref:MBL fold metallo-hydrolase n=1 Tax=Brucella haematophila TaxID=419474 RepID=UPI00110E2A7A|nr:MBL fold metallo-hydrolase [Brucella haematophila]TMV04561.1 MBL fold metallo-hydrolase [Brucella haematophila]